MAEFNTIDTSSYPKPTSGGPSILDTVGKLQGLEQQSIGIDQDKLKLINDRYGIVSRELQGLMGDKDLDINKVAGRFQNLVNLGLIPSNMMAQAMKDVPTDKSQIQPWLQMKIQQGQAIHDAVNYAYGAPTLTNQGQQLVPSRVSPKPGFGVQRAEGTPFQLQAPPTTPTIDNDPKSPTYNQPTILGPQAEQPTPGSRLPVAKPTFNNNFPGGNPMSGVDLNAPDKISPNQTVQNRFPVSSGIPTGPVPGVAEAQTATGLASGTQLAQDRTKAAAFQRDIFPLTQAIPALETLGTKGTGPGTETINHLKSFLLSNVPGVKESDFEGLDNVKLYDKAKKYLTDFVNQTGNSGTNDKLAAAFAGNPSVQISNAAAVDVAKSALALRRMQQAQLMEFENTGLHESRYSKWLAKRTQELDPRSFGVDMMNDEAKKKLLTQLNKNPKDKERFEKSLEIAHNLGFLNPSQK